MKKIYKKEEGVSPVIATILMVAITVVLAATVWLLVSGYIHPSKPALQGTLEYDYQSSNLPGWANFTLLLSQPSDGLKGKDVHMYVNGTLLTYTDYKTELNSDISSLQNKNWTYIDNDGDGKLSNGDIIVIHLEDDVKITHGSTISFGATGYSGSITATIP